nr:hypothetical transcript [Hymenolepis microstoma]
MDYDAYNADDSDLSSGGASTEFASKPVVLQPYLHPEVSSVGACCIMIRLSTLRLLRIVQLVLISSSPHIDFVDRYGEPLARIKGVLVRDSGEELYRCSSGRLSPHTECVVRFSDVHHLEPLVIQHIGVYTICPPTSPLVSHPEPPSESHTQEIVKLSSFLSTNSKTPSTRPIISSVDTRASIHTILSHSSSSSRLRLPRYTTTSAGTGGPLTATATTNTTEEPQREKSASSPAAITAVEEGFIKKETPLRSLCWQFLASMYGNHQSAEFWRRCSTCLFASLVQLTLGDLSIDRRKQDFLNHMQSIFEEATRDNLSQSDSRSDESDHQESSKTQSPPDPSHQQIVSRSFSQPPGVFPPVSGTSGFTSTSPSPPFTSRPEESILFSICSLAANLNEIRHSTTSQLNEILKRLTNQVCDYPLQRRL